MSETKKQDDGSTCKCYKKSCEVKTCPHLRNVTHPLRYYEFTQEEMKALEECDRESFYGRCLPFSALLAGLTYTAIKSDIIRPHQHFGAVPKVMAAAFMGYVLGRMSYLKQYDRKLRELPSDSKLGNLMRKYHEDAKSQPANKK